MYPFPRDSKPAVQNHLQAQVAMYNDISKAMFRTFQDVVNANITFAGSLLEESAEAGKDLLTAGDTTETLSSWSRRAQPISQKYSAYRDQMSRVAADGQNKLAQTVGTHIEETTRTSAALADDVKRSVEHQSEQTRRQFEESLRNFSDPFEYSARAGERDKSGAGASANT